ncbi:ParA family protein [Candidatus Sumerlaeota bacterium]|nr:ParA family protein [Candidatus Sumerlaeota bacterium]
MKVVSILSHKGGAGKTTLSLMLSKIHAMRGRKVCAIDLDFIGSGFEHILNIIPPKKYLDEYALCSSDPSKGPSLEELKTAYRDEELGSKQIDLILNLGGMEGVNNANSEKEKKQENHNLATALVGREPGQSIIRRSIERLLGDLEKEKYDIVFLDCHPGLAYLAKSVLELSKEKKNDYYTLFITTVNRAHFFGLIRELNFLHSPTGVELFQPEKSVLCVNRADEKTGSCWKDMKNLIDKNKKILPSGAGAIIGTYEEICGASLNYMVMRENLEILENANIGGAAKIITPGKSDISFSSTDICRFIFEGKGR